MSLIKRVEEITRGQEMHQYPYNKYNIGPYLLGIVRDFVNTRIPQLVLFRSKRAQPKGKNMSRDPNSTRKKDIFHNA
jgi:hypothetical protein